MNSGKNNKVNWFRFLALVFVLCALVYLIFLFRLRYDQRASSLLFLVPTLTMLAVIFCQTLKYGTYPGLDKIILFEIFIFTFLLHLFRVLPARAGAFGDDFLPFYYNVRYLVDTGFFATASGYSEAASFPNPGLVFSLSRYPTLLLNGAIPSLITGQDLISIMRWLPPVWTVVGIMAIYLISKSIFNDRRAALVATMGFSAYVYSIESHSQYIRETIAFTILLFLVYAFYTAYRYNRVELKILAILFTIALVLAHFYVTAVMLSLFLLFGACAILIRYATCRRWLPVSSLAFDSVVPWNFIALSATLSVGYWLYMERGILSALALQVQQMIRYGSFTAYASLSTIPSFVEQALAYSSRFFNYAFPLILLAEVIRGIRGRCAYLREDFFIAAWVALIFFIFPNILMATKLALPAGRLLPFSIPFMLIGVAHAGSNMKRHLIGMSIMVLVALYVVLNLLSFPLLPQGLIGDVERVQKVSLPKGDIVYTDFFLPQSQQGIEATDFYSKIENGKLTRWFDIGKTKILAEAYQAEGDNPPGFPIYTKQYVIRSQDAYDSYDKVYDNGEVYVYR